MSYNDRLRIPNSHSATTATKQLVLMVLIPWVLMKKYENRKLRFMEMKEYVDF